MVEPYIGLRGRKITRSGQGDDLRFKISPLRFRGCGLAAAGSRNPPDNNFVVGSGRGELWHMGL